MICPFFSCISIISHRLFLDLPALVSMAYVMRDLTRKSCKFSSYSACSCVYFSKLVNSYKSKLCCLTKYLLQQITKTFVRQRFYKKKTQVQHVKLTSYITRNICHESLMMLVAESEYVSISYLS